MPIGSVSPHQQWYNAPVVQQVEQTEGFRIPLEDGRFESFPGAPNRVTEMTAVALKENSRRDPTKLRCLVLNADGRPLSTYPPSIVSAQDAISALWRERAFVVEEWPDVFFRSPSTTIAVPKTMMLKEYANVAAVPKFCRRSVILRDRFRCQYCGQRFDSSELTYDHVIPRSAGGKTTWDNVLTACVSCNTKKRDTLPNFSGRKNSGLRPLKLPRRPTTVELLRAGMEFLPNDIREGWPDFLYWTATLES